MAISGGPLHRPIHDPACGEGRIVEAARRAGYVATGSDLVDRGYGTGGIDFYKDRTPRSSLVCNPPYGQEAAEAFLAHGFEVVARGEIAIIVTTPFVCCQHRYHRFYAKTPPGLILPIWKRPSMPPGDSNSPPRNGTADYLWLLWQIPFSDPRLLLRDPPAVLPAIWWLPP